ncbi:MAG: HlyD family efflux transporter periplasmic adaptor subunit [Anaerolineae bacterium]|nr:HlyD family efflux transporter periplasmic adaptor subunit [Anaerolineae bacterium]
MRRKGWVALALIALMLGGCGREGVVEQGTTPTPRVTEAPAATPRVKQPGVMVLAEGVLQAAQPALPLAFERGGRLLAVHVALGDRVEAGGLVATLDDATARDEVAGAELSLALAELALEELARAPDPAALAAARANLASAKASLAAATSSLAALTAPPREQQVLAAEQSLRGAKQALQDLLDLPDPDAVQIAKSNLTAAEMQVQAAQAAYDQVAALPYASMTGEAMSLWQATTNYERAQAEYHEALEGATDDQLAAARARVALAQADLDALHEDAEPAAVAAAQAQVVAAEAQVDQAQAALDVLLAGAPAGDTTRAEINVAQARLSLQSAQRALDGIELTAPAGGTVIAVHAAPGTLVGSGSPIVTLLDMTQLEFQTTNLSERDLAQIVHGEGALVTLKAYPDDPLHAVVVRIGAQAGGAVGDAVTFPVILALDQSDLDLRPGMTGRVEIGPEAE